MALTYLILCLCFSQVFPSISALTYKCNEPNKQLVEQLRHQYGLDIFDVDHVFTYDYGDTFVDLPTRNYTALFLAHVKVNFTGHLIPIGRNAGFLTKQNFDTNTVVVHHKVVNRMQKCEINEADFLKTKGSISPKLSVIHKLTTACLQEFTCDQWGGFISNDFLMKQKLDSTIETIFREYYATSTSTTEAPSTGPYNLQGSWNLLFDAGKNVGIDQLVGKTNGVLVMSEMKFNFSKLGSDGDIVMKNISIDGLTSLERTKDVVVNRFKNRYDLSTGVQLTNLKVKIPYYESEYFKIGIDGIIGATISKIGVSVKVHLDYNSHPCKIVIDELTKDKLEDPKVDYTGLGPLNWGVRKIAEYFIRNKLFDMAKQMVASKMKELNCEKYRSTVESLKF